MPFMETDTVEHFRLLERLSFDFPHSYSSLKEAASADCLMQTNYRKVTLKPRYVSASC
jgi:hypothetical protein